MHTILITGGAGYIGSHIGYVLAQKGYGIIVLDALQHNQYFNHSWATFIHGDCGDTALLNQIFTHYKIKTVIHCAASIEVAASTKQPLEYYHNNVINTFHLLETMIRHRINQFIFSSSCAVYGIPNQLPISEDDATRPVNPYGNTKLMIEMMLQDFAIAYGLQSVSLRYFNVAGALPERRLVEFHNPETHLIPLLLDAVIHNKIFTIFGTDHATPDGTCIRDYVHVLDIAHAHGKSLEYLDNNSGFHHFNIGSGKGISVKKLISLIEHLTGTQLTVSYNKKRVGDPACLIGDITKATSLLGWNPFNSDINQILQSAFNSFYLNKSNKLYKQLF